MNGAGRDHGLAALSSHDGLGAGGLLLQRPLPRVEVNRDTIRDMILLATKPHGGRPCLMVTIVHDSERHRRGPLRGLRLPLDESGVFARSGTPGRRKPAGHEHGSSTALPRRSHGAGAIVPSLTPANARHASRSATGPTTINSGRGALELMSPADRHRQPSLALGPVNASERAALYRRRHEANDDQHWCKPLHVTAWRLLCENSTGVRGHVRPGHRHGHGDGDSGDL